MPDKLFGWTKEKVLENKISSLERQLGEAKQNNQDLIHLIENLTKRIHDLDQAYFNKSQDYIDLMCEKVEIQDNYDELKRLSDNFSKAYADDLASMKERYEELLEENLQLGLESQCLMQSLNRDLKTAQQVAQYWKLEYQANEILTDIYKERGGEFHDSI